MTSPQLPLLYQVDFAVRSSRNGFRAVALACAFCLAGAAAWLLAASPALASHTQVAIMEDDANLVSNPDGTLKEMRHLGVQMVRMTMRWSSIAPAGSSRRRPRFNAADPGAYPARNWAPYDRIVRDAQADGIKVLFTVTGFAPLWAQGPNPGHYYAHYNPYWAFEPSAREYAQFVRAVGTRYSGTFSPRGQAQALPRVTDWEVWNEANFGEDLAPQAIQGSRILYAPRMYRALLGAGWGSLRATGHGSDTIVIGALAARGAQRIGVNRPGAGLPGTYGETPPLLFIRELYCLDSRYHRYLGAAAAVRGCPTKRRGYARFRSQNPALFAASGFSDHPYPVNQPPNRAASRDPNYTDFNELPRMGRVLDRIQRIYGSGKRFPIWNTEYGYITCPPTCNRVNHPRYLSPATSVGYINWAEYLSWQNPRIVTTMQYLLYDPNPSVGTPEYGGFASGLIYYPTILGGTPKRTYYGYRLPIYLPSTSAASGHALTVWGDVRPAPYAASDTQQPQYAQIEFAPRSGSWQTLKTVQVTDPHGYFQASVVFPSSGSVRIAWTYPPLDLALGSTMVSGYAEPLGPTTSRQVQITLR